MLHVGISSLFRWPYMVKNNLSHKCLNTKQNNRW